MTSAVSAGAPPAPPRTAGLLLAVCAVTLLCTVGMAMPYPILAPIFVDGPADGFTRYGGMAPEWLLGLALAANPAGILLGSLVLGPLSDRLGRRRVLVTTLLACAAGNLLTAWALAERQYPLFVVARFLTGLTEGNIAVARALLADHHGEATRVRAFAWLNACQYGGWLVGPLVGGLSLSQGDAVPFVLAAAAMLPCAAWVRWAVPGGKPTLAAPGRTAAPSGGRSTLGPLLHDAALRRLAGLQLLYTCGVTALYEYAPLWCVTEASFTSTGIAWITAAQCAAMLAGTAVAGRLPSHQPLATAAAAAGAASLGLLGLALLPVPAGLVALVLLGLPLAVYNAFLPAWVSQRFGGHGQGRMMGLLTTLFCLANVLTAVAGGALSLWEVRWVMAVGAGCALAAALSLAALARAGTAPAEGHRA